MKNWPQYLKTALNASAEFTCPHCMAGTFEIIGTERNINNRGDEDCDVIMRCMRCTEYFWHRVAHAEEVIELEPAQAN